MVSNMPKQIILDCDPGHDDAVAIMLAAASKEIELLGITCVGEMWDWIIQLITHLKFAL